MLVVISGDKGFAGAFNSNITKTAYQFIDGIPTGRSTSSRSGARGAIALSALSQCELQGANGRERREAVDAACAQGQGRDHGRTSRYAAELEANRVIELAQIIIERYVHEEIDAVYIVYNEFKSVISQRLVVEKLLPIRRSAKHQIAEAEELTAEQSGASCRKRR